MLTKIKTLPVTTDQQGDVLRASTPKRSFAMGFEAGTLTRRLLTNPAVRITTLCMLMGAADPPGFSKVTFGLGLAGVALLGSAGLIAREMHIKALTQHFFGRQWADLSTQFEEQVVQLGVPFDGTEDNISTMRQATRILQKVLFFARISQPLARHYLTLTCQRNSAVNQECRELVMGYLAKNGHDELLPG